MDANRRASAADVANTSSSSTGTATRMKNTIADKAAEAKETVNEFSRRAASKLGGALGDFLSTYRNELNRARVARGD